MSSAEISIEAMEVAYLTNDMSVQQSVTSENEFHDEEGIFFFHNLQFFLLIICYFLGLFSKSLNKQIVLLLFISFWLCIIVYQILKQPFYG